MTTDDFTEAARAEAEERYPIKPTDIRTVALHGRARADFADGADWGRDYYAAQEPTEELLDYVAAAISECDGIYFQDCIRRNPGIARMYRRQARAALTAARRYEEKR